MLLKLLSFFSGNKARVLIGTGSLLVLLFAGVGGYVKGSSKASVECAQAQTTAILEGEKAYEETKQDVMRLSPDSLDRRLSEWMRD